ncbi:hypothetical protein HSBAA_18030 [Vreelandella sulfidaeris]|uniref:Gamma-glutamyltranspeptidase n=1 Tax=Vreelandella sulfidaeris TaxID=115553 RepID=A0A455U4M1_9GAMM|nr:hypothetical protein HSBAA_18030 [Halomonas sulfidaeris]
MWKTAALSTLLADAIRHAEAGIAVSQSQQALTAKHLERLSQSPGFSDALLLNGQVPHEGERLRQPRLAATLKRLAEAGLDDFYRGELAASMARDLEAVGSPLRLADFHAYQAQQVTPLEVTLQDATLYNLPAPTQGMASLMILAIYERLKAAEPNSFEHLHGLIEATKRAFILRDQNVTDPGRVPTPLQELLSSENIGREAANIDPQHALPWPHEPAPGDTIWMGTVDSQGRAVSFIQSIYWEFGSGVVLPESGVLWQNRGISFRLILMICAAWPPAVNLFTRSTRRLPSLTMAAPWFMAPWAVKASRKPRRRFLTLCAVRHAASAGNHRTALAARAHLGKPAPT